MSQPAVLVVEDDPALREALCETLKLAGYRALAAADGEAALALLAVQEPGLVITDVRMDGMDGQTLLKRIRSRDVSLPVLMMTAYGTIQNAVQAMRDGAMDYLVKPFDAQLLVSKVARYLVERAPAVDEPVAADARTRELVALARRVATNDVTVLISGESGTGKEVLARCIHRGSKRSGKPFVAINCAAIPDNMLEAVLFGYEKGAFTGAVQACPGKFEQAQGGTLLLDEISEMDLALQAKLLRVLQEREVERLGGRRLIALDVRVIATSNRQLRDEVAAGRFREDLFYRLNVFPLHLPPLRERPDDILPLAKRMVARYAESHARAAPNLTPAAQAKLIGQVWQGNVRELENVIQRTMIMQSGATIDAQDLQFETGSASSVEPRTQAAPAAETLGDDLKSREQRVIIEALQAESGSRTQAARRLGISQRTLRYKLARMREMGIALP